MTIATPFVNPGVAATPIAPFSPLGKPSHGSGPATSLEDSANPSFAPVEQLEESERSNSLSERDRDARRGETPASESGSEARKEQRQAKLEQEEIRELASRDREVRAHEQAHASVGGQYAGSASFSYTRGPDGVLYATGGEVPIDSSPVPGDPVATLRKLQVVQRAALAPVDPSAADRSIAAQAARGQIDARADLAQQRSAEAAEAREAREAGQEEGNALTSRRSLADRFADTGALDAGQPPRTGGVVNTAA